MMTSVSLPSNSGPLHAGYSTVAEEPTGDSDFESPRASKRCLPVSLAESCKKRRKQSTPVRISAVDSDPNPTEGKPVPSPEPELKCPVCQLIFDNHDKLESHVKSEHSLIECKKEIEDLPTQIQERSNTPIELTAPRSELPWMTDLQNKEWLNPTILPFTTANHMFMSLSQFPQADQVPPRQPIRIFNPDAYCELCNKEFCNKYFLKTHKANKHGIYSDPPTTDALVNTVNVPSYAANIKLPNTVPSIDVKNELKAPVTALNPFSDLFTNPFTNKMLTKPSKPISKEQDLDQISNGASQDQERATEEPITEESCSPRIQQDTTLIKTEVVEQDGLYYTSPSKMSPGQQARELDLSNRLRRIGVMNPKAFCEICCKEYCNKYFLRTHKMKRHGIYIPDEGKERDVKVDSFGNLLWSSQNTQTSPLNLIMAEQSNSSMQSERKTSSPADISCELCGIKFQNASLAQLHNVSVHPKINQAPQEVSNGSEEEKIGETNEKSASATDTISEDLQKLQTMILQLNDLDVNNKISCACSVCSKEFENRYFLHTHMMTEHGLLLDEVADNEKSCEGDSNINNNTLCDLCGKDFQNVQEMKKHASEFHSNPTNETKEEFNGFTTPEKSTSRAVNSGQLPERRGSMNLTPTSSYCEICNKELCNKYFMKTHMQKMHGIEIENGAQIGGVICDICNKELCSKYFLRVHKHNTHGIVEYGPSLLQPRKGDEQATHIPTETDTSLKPTDLADLSHRYFTHFTEVCTICSRRFRSTKWLKAHLLSDHGQAGVDKWSELEQQLQHTMNQHKPIAAKNSPQSERVSPTLKIPNGGQENQTLGIQNVLSSIFGDDENNMKTYDCSYCPFSTPILPFLFVHERSHSMQSDNEHGPLKCPVCGQTFLQSELLQHHIFSQHPFLPLPPFFNGNAEQQLGEISKEPSESAEEIEDGGSCSETSKQGASKGGKKVRRKFNSRVESSETGSSLRDVAKRSQLPATYALPQVDESTSSNSNPSYVMQAFLLEESGSERRFMPSLVFLPVLQKLSAPNTVTFTLTPA